MTTETDSKLRVLVVDDDPLVRTALTRTLRHRGLETIEVSDGASALEALGRERIAVVLSDINMAGMNGIELLRAIRVVDLDVPVILLTGAPSIETASQAVRLGALEYLTKPTEPEQLVASIRRAYTLGALARAKRDALEHDIDPRYRTGDRASLEAAFARFLESAWVAFQPIVRANGTLLGYEALLRSREPALPHPGAVLGAAERLGQLRTLGRHIRWLVAEAMLPKAEDVFVNLHPTDVFDDELLDPKSPLSSMAARVVLEITERAALEDVDETRRRIEVLRSRGYRIAIDDLGAGYAGLSAFAALDPDVCKLDMSLVRDVDHHPKKRRLVETMARLCGELGILVVAEGVETRAELDCLRECRCDLYQGYLLGKPAPPFPGFAWPVD